MKKLIATTTAIISSLAFALPVYAQGSVDICAGGQFSGLCQQKGGDFTSVIGSVIQILFIIAVVIAIFFLVWGGIKWILSNGDKAKIESARGTIIGAIIGLIFVFLSYFLLQLVAGLFGIDIQNLEIPQLFSRG